MCIEHLQQKVGDIHPWLHILIILNRDLN